MDAPLGFQIPEGILPVDLERHRLDPGLLTGQIVQHLHGKALALCPPAVHPVKDAAPVAGFGASGSGVETHDGMIAIVFPCQQGTEPQGLQLIGKLIHHLLDLRNDGRIVFLVPHFDHQTDFFVLVLKPVKLRDRIF